MAGEKYLFAQQARDIFVGWRIYGLNGTRFGTPRMFWDVGGCLKSAKLNSVSNCKRSSLVMVFSREKKHKMKKHEKK